MLIYSLPTRFFVFIFLCKQLEAIFIFGFIILFFVEHVIFSLMNRTIMEYYFIVVVFRLNLLIKRGRISIWNVFMALEKQRYYWQQ